MSDERRLGGFFGFDEHGRLVWYTVYPDIRAHGDGNPQLNQRHFRFRNDDGSESAASWLKAEDTNITVGSTGDIALDTNVRLRVQLHNADADDACVPMHIQLRYSKNSGSYTAIDGASSNVRMANTANLTTGSDTTKQLTGSETFVTDNDGQCEDTAARPSTGGTEVGVCSDSGKSVGAGQILEAEWCLQFRSADLADTDTIDLRVYKGNALVPSAPNTYNPLTATGGSDAHGSYTVTPRATVSTGAAAGQPYIKRVGGVPHMARGQQLGSRRW